jgi:hypothetical protein
MTVLAPTVLAPSAPNLQAKVQAELLQTLIAALGGADSRGAGAGKPPIMQATLLGFVADAAGQDQPATQAEAGSRQSGAAQRIAEALIGGRIVRLMLEPGSAPAQTLVAGARLALAFEPSPGEGPPRARIVDVGASVPAAARSSEADAASTPASPRALAAPAAIAALARQDSAASLIATAQMIASQPATAASLPAPVQRAVAALLGLATSAETLAKPDGAPLRQAIARSGLFHDNAQARADAKAGGDAAGPPLDLKGALLALKRALLAAGANPEPAANARHQEGPLRQELPGQQPVRPAPPIPDGPLQPRGDVTARPPDGASVTPLLAQLLGETEAALDRLTLLQFASLPDAGGDGERAQGSSGQGVTQPSSAHAPTRLTLEVPFLLDGKAGVLPLSIEEEPPDRVRGEGEAPRSGWRLRLAFDLEPLGLVQALIGLQAGAVRVAVFAEREATARLARRHAGDLEAALADGPFTAAVVDVALGAPPAARARAGHFLDRRT